MSKCDASLNIFVDFVHATKASNNIEIKFIYIEVPTNIYLFKVNNRNTRKRCKICLKLTIKTPEGPKYVLTGVLNMSVFNLITILVSGRDNSSLTLTQLNHTV